MYAMQFMCVFSLSLVTFSDHMAVGMYLPSAIVRFGEPNQDCARRTHSILEHGMRRFLHTFGTLTQKTNLVVSVGLVRPARLRALFGSVRACRIHRVQHHGHFRRRL